MVELTVTRLGKREVTSYDELKKIDVDVLVAGGGVAGVSAALTAARSGLRTLLVESQISLGGLATNRLCQRIAGWSTATVKKC